MLECKHYTAELYRADAKKLNDEVFVRRALIEAAEQAKATLIEVRTHAFHPQGVTGFALLAESHISIHTWPEHCYAAVDAFTCGEVTDPELACLHMAYVFNASSYALTSVERANPTSLRTV